ncbi:hypothetical protein TRFO_18040 [Tritrichomonas foetus]|uniref:Signal peptidase complex subunit 2 n=1 Tax=Tritrichomonas foetus TaxID=1144522 RepID=A0A1J4KLZ1_9EUKA|nr:hypothetical protein TRFO_18040 [Tritrichomonas foetus]|eukprot:OHT12235.1 hypothetical protein TRFO_18040 [Tritrichomonas foetus]
MGSNTRFDLTNANILKREMNSILVSQFAAQKAYQNRFLEIFIGVSKIINATALMSLYGWMVPWEKKLGLCLVFVFYSCLTYLIEYGLSIFWWPNYFATFEKEGSNQKFIVCTNVPFYSGDFHISIYLSKSASYFQRLSKPVVDETYSFTQFFTQSGYMITHDWESKCDEIIKKSIHSKIE